jgi:hypothetical protein
LIEEKEKEKEEEVEIGLLKAKLERVAAARRGAMFAVTVERGGAGTGTRSGQQSRWRSSKQMSKQ